MVYDPLIDISEILESIRVDIKVLHDQEHEILGARPICTVNPVEFIDPVEERIEGTQDITLENIID